MTDISTYAVCAALLILVGAPPFCWYVDRWLDATRAHVTEIVTTKDEPEKA
jgi:hypothetical protein